MVCESSVRAAIHRVFAACFDLGVIDDLYRDAEQNTWLWTWEHLEELRDPSKSRAKLKTRLYAVAKFAALTIRKSLLRAKDRTSDLSVSRLGTDQWGGLVMESNPNGDQFDPYERRETVGACP
jgi:hypothetical protein